MGKNWNYSPLHSDGIFITKENIMELNRFKQLLESELGNVKPLIMEQSNNGITTLITWAKEKNKDDSYCKPKEKKWINMDDRGYCPKGTWTYTMNGDRFDYYDKRGNLIGSDSKVPPTQEYYNGSVNDIADLSRWVKDKKTDVKGTWSYGGNVYFYDDKKSFIGQPK